jgi:hypothetical protein
MAYRPVDQRIFQVNNYNPVQRDEMARAAGYTGYNDFMDQYNRGLTLEQQQNKPAPTAAEVTAKLMAELQKKMDELAARAKEWDARNPFAFDELIARASTSAEYSPYYEAELRDFISGITKRRQDVQQEQKLITELNQLASTVEQQKLGQEVEKIQQEFNLSNLYGSGQQQRAQALAQIQAQQAEKERQQRYQAQLQTGQRELGQIGVEEQQQKRRVEAEKTAQIEQEVLRKKQEAAASRETARAEYLGPQYAAYVSGGLGELVNKGFANY